ncbi:hypothetical protein Xvie_01246 [Xenorhabdus vietnamensis]|uniref:Uncharacterized protein n=1 Tax=Xenorhabdus vietnamensis TaxID=351656 RepID=A0A1Y2SFC8_9GAMM|nr:hypothetical protein [Xenorhabdus vietnamensis]OTA17394.1 hypothetical protein Xvie_01246 [Xenorhabdus vietnamensis]
MNKIKSYDKNNKWNSISELRIRLRRNSINEKNKEMIMFANGRNMATIDVYIQLKNAQDNVIKDISEELLDDLTESIFLIDYNTGEKLIRNAQEKSDFKWSYRNMPNEFTATPSIIVPNPLTLIERDSVNLINKSKGLKIFTFYVYCSAKEVNQVKQIGALVHAPDGKHSTAYGEIYDDHVQLKAIGEVIYTKDSLEIERKFIVNNLGDQSIRKKLGGNWLQYNTYVSLKVKDNYGKRYITKLQSDDIPDCGAYQLYHHDYGYDGYYIHFLWPLGKKKWISVGNTKWMELSINFELGIMIRQKPNAICFTVLYVSSSFFPKLQDRWKDIEIFIYDQYGNRGKFLLKHNNKNETEKEKIHIEDVKE